MNERTRIWAVVPVKSFARAKARLAPLLDSGQREELACAMLQDVLAALQTVAQLSGILVVSQDARAQQIARAHGARIVEDRFEEGPNAAIRLAMPLLRECRADAMVVVPSDVPQIEADELLPILQRLRSAGVALVPAARDGGTNLLGCSPIDVIEPCFGPESFAKHVNAAKHLALEPAVFLARSLMHDIDRSQDLREFRARHATRTEVCLGKWVEQTHMPDDVVFSQ
jgi:2-phospho-L-lactate guanylyltransferase